MPKNITKNWFYLELNGTNGKELELVPPFETIPIDDSDNFVSIIDYNGVEVSVLNKYKFSTERDALKGMLRSFKFFYLWHADTRNAPVAEKEAYGQKIQIMCDFLFRKYHKRFPELFV